MMIECIGEAFVYRWPEGEIHLEPGQPVELPDERAQRLLLKAPGRVRVIPRPGDRIMWTRGDGSTPHGVIDFVHRTEDGAIWGFVSFEKNTWAAINLKFARVVA